MKKAETIECVISSEELADLRDLDSGEAIIQNTYSHGWEDDPDYRRFTMILHPREVNDDQA